MWLPLVCLTALLSLDHTPWRSSGGAVRSIAPVRLEAASLCGEAGAPRTLEAAALRRLARDSEERLARERSSPALVDAALVQLAGGRPSSAIALLDEARGQGRDACVLVALSAAHHVAAGDDAAAPAHLLQALADAHRAAVLAPDLREAHANEARARERLGLRLSAAASWQRAGVPAAEPARSDDARAALLSACERGDPAALRALALRHRQEARVLGEEELLSRAAAADPSALAAALTIAEALDGAGGDPLLGESARAVQTARGPRRDRMARGFAALAGGLARSQRDDWRGAASSLAVARQELEASGSPYATAVPLHQAVAAFYLPDYAGATAFLDATRDVTRYPAVTGRAAWLRGLLEQVRGHPLEALAEHRRAVQAFSALGELGHAAFVESLLAGDLQAAHHEAEAWQHRRQALLALDHVREPRRLYSIVWDASRSLLEAGRPLEASLLLDELSLRIGPGSDPILRATVLLRRARVAHQLGDDAAARADVEAANAVRADVTGSFAARLDADADAVAGEIDAVVAPAEAVRTLSEALREFEQSGHNPNVVRLLSLRAQAHRRLGQVEAAQADLRALVDGFVRYGRHLQADSERLAYLQAAERAADALVSMALEAGDARSALEAVERVRHSGTVRPMEGPPGANVLAYAVAEGDVVTWLLRGSDLRVRRDRGAAATVLADVEALERAVAHEDAEASRLVRQRLSARLVAPFAADLGGGGALVVVPDKWLHRVPFAALTDGGGRLLVERWTVTVAPSVTEVARVAPDGRVPARLLAAGAPAPRSAEVLGLPPLPAVERELAALAMRHPGQRILTGAQATAEQVAAALADADLVHLAAHGVSVGTRSGLLFEAPAAAGLDGGLLASAAVERLRLPRRPVVVLASCRSGAAGPDAARVPATLARAFLAAGARAVVATLWDVGDEAAAELALALDERLASGRDAAGALREVQAGMASRRTLRDWAGFYVLTAEVRPSSAAGGRSGRGGGS